MANRFDVCTTKKWKLDKRGRLIVEATPTRSGVFDYYEQDGKGGFKLVRELRHPDDVFSRETMDSLNGIPYTTQDNHVSLMTPENVRKKTYGYTLSNAKRVDNHSAINIKINDKEEIDAVMNGGSLELSNGYTCDIKQESGTFEGERYDQRQVNIIYDHVARVTKARGGETCRIRLDSQSAICGVEAGRLDSGNQETIHNEENMDEKKEVIKIHEKDLKARESGNFRLDADTITIPAEQKDNFAKMEAREDKLFNALKDSDKSLTEAQVKLDASQSEIADLKSQLENAVPSERMDEEIQSRLDSWDLAKGYGIKDYKTKAVSELNKEILKESKMYDESRFDNADYVAFAIEHLKSDQIQKISKSRRNLESSYKDDKRFDSSDDINEPSELEKA